MDVRLIDANKFLKWLDVGHLRNPSEICLSEINVKNMIDLQPTIDPESLPIVFELRRELRQITHDSGQDIWAVERRRREQIEEELKRVKKELRRVEKERDSILKQISGDCGLCANFEKCRNNPTFCINGNMWKFDGDYKDE